MLLILPKKAPPTMKILKSITTPLVNVILDQARVCPPEITKAEINAKNCLHNSRSQHAPDPDVVSQ